MLSRSRRLVPELSVRSLSCSCCLRPRSLEPLLHSGVFQRLILDVRPSQYYTILGVSLVTVSPAPLPPAGGGRFSRYKSFLGPFLLLAALRGQIAGLPPPPQSFDWRNRYFSVGNFMMLLCGWHHSFVGNNLRRSWVGHRPFLMAIILS
jgi:hypothetical protein